MDMMEVRRRVMLSMASGAKVIKGTVTLTENQRNLAIPLSFEPTVILVVLREVDSSQTSYKCVYGCYTKTESPPTIELNFVYTLGDTTYDATGMRFTNNAVIPTISNTEAILPARSTAINWAIGTYDYMLIE